MIFFLTLSWPCVLFLLVLLCIVYSSSWACFIFLCSVLVGLTLTFCTFLFGLVLVYSLWLSLGCLGLVYSSSWDSLGCV
ncbi:hypothetical protein XELAEV_18001860mg [Xenopus laevis]|nr:hypothetical protein XELAEV_18001860mg [Xenopus laevis]